MTVGGLKKWAVSPLFHELNVEGFFSTKPGGPIFLDRRAELRMKQHHFQSALRRL